MSYCFDMMLRGLNKYNQSKYIKTLIYYMVERLHDISHENQDKLNCDKQLRKLASKLENEIKEKEK